MWNIASKWPSCSFALCQITWLYGNLYMYISPAKFNSPTQNTNWVKKNNWLDPFIVIGCIQLWFIIFFDPSSSIEIGWAVDLAPGVPYTVKIQYSSASPAPWATPRYSQVSAFPLGIHLDYKTTLVDKNCIQATQWYQMFPQQQSLSGFVFVNLTWDVLCLWLYIMLLKSRWMCEEKRAEEEKCVKHCHF